MPRCALRRQGAPPCPLCAPDVLYGVHRTSTARMHAHRVPSYICRTSLTNWSKSSAVVPSKSDMNSLKVRRFPSAVSTLAARLRVRQQRARPLS